MSGTEHFYRFTSRGVGIYEAVESDCPRDDSRRVGKPDGAWLPKVGPSFPKAISFWTSTGLKKYHVSGLRLWHQSVLKSPVEVMIGVRPSTILHRDEFQIICTPSEIETKAIIRQARTGDADGIAAVHVNSWKTTYAGMIPDDFLRNISFEKRRDMWKGTIEQIASGDQSKCLYVVTNAQDRIFGFVCGGKERTNHPDCDAELFAIYLEKSEQQVGVGSKLVLELALWLQANGYRKMLLWVLDNNPTRTFYEKIGGKLLSDSKQVDFGGKQCTEVAYGWDNLPVLIDRLSQ